MCGARALNIMYLQKKKHPYNSFFCFCNIIIFLSWSHGRGLVRNLFIRNVVLSTKEHNTLYHILTFFFFTLYHILTFFSFTLYHILTFFSFTLYYILIFFLFSFLALCKLLPNLLLLV